MRALPILCILFLTHASIAQNKITTVYLLSGQGSDERIFKNLSFDSAYNIRYLPYLLPEEDENMHDFAYRMSKQIDTTSPFVIIGVSLGGMIATEMTSFISPEKVILLSSASSSDEIPKQYSFFRKSALHKEIPAWVFKNATYILQPSYEPDRNFERATCQDMIKDKNALFMKRATHLIVTWTRTEAENAGKSIVQIHGDIDHTLPIKNITADYIIKNGSHMMTLMNAVEISDLLLIILKN